MQKTAIGMNKMKSLLIVAGFISASGLLFGASTADAASITLLNPSFEDPALSGTDNWIKNPDFSGWTEAGGNSIYVKKGSYATAYGSPLPDGLQIAEMGSGGSIWQNTGVTMEAGKTYTFSTYASGGSTGTLAHGYLYAADDATSLGSSLVDQQWSPASAAWGVYDVSYTCDSAHAGKYLTVKIGVTNTVWVGFDNASAASAATVLMNMSSPVSQSIITGGTANLGVTVGNASTTSNAINYSLAAGGQSGSVSLGSVNPGSGSIAYGGAAQNNTVSASSTNIGDNTVTFTATDPNAANSGLTQDVTLTVLDHANASFAAADQNDLTLDLGTYNRSTGTWVSGTGSAGYDIYNLVSTAAYTARLDLDSFTADDSIFSSGLSTFSNLVAGLSHAFIAGFNPTGLGDGSYSKNFSLTLSDENLPGATTQGVTLHLQGNVIPEPGALALLVIGGIGMLIRRRRRA